MTNKHQTPFNKWVGVKSELPSEEKRNEKIAEMAARGFEVSKLYEFRKDRSGIKYRYCGDTGKIYYGVMFKPASSVEGKKEEAK